MLTAAMHMLDSSPWRQGLLPPPPPPPTTTATLHHLHTTGRRIAKRRPRPSRRLPTTYISADPANFRRMVHQVTGADDLLPPPPPSLSSPPELLRPLPTSAGSAGAGALMLPTLDTSAFLLGFKARPAAPTEAVAPPWDGSQALVGGGGGGGSTNYSANYSNSNNNSNSSSSGNCGGFPTLDSWDLL